MMGRRAGHEHGREGRGELHCKFTHENLKISDERLIFGE